MLYIFHLFFYIIWSNWFKVILRTKFFWIYLNQFIWLATNNLVSMAVKKLWVTVGCNERTAFYSDYIYFRLAIVNCSLVAVIQTYSLFLIISTPPIVVKPIVFWDWGVLIKGNIWKIGKGYLNIIGQGKFFFKMLHFFIVPSGEFSAEG